MKKNKISLYIVFFCLILVAVLAALHLSTRVKVPENAILVKIGDKTDYIDLKTLNLSPVQGEIMNGKGETKQISEDGLLLRDAINSKQLHKFDQIQIVANDEYSAVLEVSEVLNEDKVYLTIKDGSASLCVFGDKNSKRNVTDIKQIIFIKGVSD